MKKLILMILMVLLNINLFSKSPYHSLDENNYDNVVNALEKPEWLNNYCRNNFRYISDKNQYGADEVWASSETIFKNRAGDCEDWANFQLTVLQKHNIDAKLLGILNGLNSHMITIFNYNNKCGWMDNTGLYYPYNSQDELIKFVCPKKNYQFINTYNEKEYIAPNIKTHNNKYAYSSRLNLHLHLTECQYGLESFLPIKNNLNGFAIGYLYNLNNPFFNGLGFSFSSHGYYSDFKTSNKMYSFHFLMINRILGISTYFGDYNGIDFDIHFINSKFIDGYVNCRNFGEILDYKLIFKPIKLLNINSEIQDKEFIISSYIMVANALQIGYSINQSINLILKPDLPISIFINLSINFNNKNINSIILKQQIFFN